jgi:hypothetical protein
LEFPSIDQESVEKCELAHTSEKLSICLLDVLAAEVAAALNLDEAVLDGEARCLP